MGRKRYGFDENRINRFIKEGRGQGTGKNYKPWLTVADVPSLGRVHRVFCPKTEREHHLMSDNEYYAFLLQWWDDSVLDIREQYPLLNRKETLEIAARSGIRHPMDPVSRTLWVLTTDLVLTVRNANGNKTVAYAVKEAKALENERTLEKLEIERRYWERREVKWQILTNEQVKNNFTKNLSWILGNEVAKTAPSPFQDYLLSKIKKELVVKQRALPRLQMRLLCSSVDEKMDCRPGTTLSVFRKLIEEKKIHVDLNLRSIQDLPANAFRMQVP